MNITYFTEYNYELMTDPDYKEDTVREEIIAPLINLLGYSVGSENKIIRSKPLKHPFLTVGSNSRKVTYIPDYLLEVKNIKVLVLDAKAPNENIISGKNVEQAYSYAIHPEIRTNLFSLCNGKEFSIFTLYKNLTEAQQNLVFDRYGAGLKIEDIRMKEISRTGVPVTQQAFTNRINKIKKKIRKLIEPVMES